MYFFIKFRLDNHSGTPSYLSIFISNISRELLWAHCHNQTTFLFFYFILCMNILVKVISHDMMIHNYRCPTLNTPEANFSFFFPIIPNVDVVIVFHVFIRTIFISTWYSIWFQTLYSTSELRMLVKVVRWLMSRDW